MQRCDWATNDLAIRYHDEEWGVLVHDDRRWFEFLVLEGAQAGLGWDTILKRRDGYRAAFDGLDPSLVAGYDARKVEWLFSEPGIIRFRLKIPSTIRCAGAFLEVRRAFGCFDDSIWRFVDGLPIENRWETRQAARTAEPDLPIAPSVGQGHPGRAHPPIEGSQRA